MRYAIVIEKAEGNYLAYVPDLSGCVAAGATVAEVEAESREAIVFQVEGRAKTECRLPMGRAESHTSKSQRRAELVSSPCFRSTKQTESRRSPAVTQNRRAVVSALRRSVARLMPMGPFQDNRS